MLVNNTKDSASSITLGAQESTAFKMTEDTSLLMMLSTNLYSNPELAAIRETLCNAWDAHIEAGTTDKPIVITVTSDNDLIIQDSGLGIPHDKMSEIYGTYGNSTKRDNNAVTGGFGLGCKSPFAVAESFRVTNEHAGKKVVWQMTRADITLDGKPGMTPVVEVPTDRTGITLNFRLPKDEVKNMIQYIHAVVKHGGMNATLSVGMLEGPSKLPVLDMSHEPGSYSLSSDEWYYSYMGDHSIFVRYGAVVYPMLRTPAIEKQVALIQDFMQVVGYSRLLVQAAPGTLALNPSREALSSVSITVNGLTDLCVNLVRNLEDDIIKQIPKSVEALCKFLRRGHHNNVDSIFDRIDSWDSLRPRHVYYYMNSQLGSKYKAKYKNVIKEAENSFLRKNFNFSNTKITDSFMHVRKNASGSWHSYSSNYINAMAPLVIKYSIKPIAKVFIKNPVLIVRNKLFLVPVAGYQADLAKDNWVNLLAAHTYYSSKRAINFITKPTVFIHTNRARIGESIGDYFEKVTNGHRNNAAWVYIIKRNDVNKDKIIKAFASKFTVVDLTENHEWDDVAQERLASLANRKAKTSKVSTKGTVDHKPNILASITNYFDNKGNAISSKISEDSTMVENPKYFVESSMLFRNGAIGRLGMYSFFPEDLRNQTVVTTNGVEMRMAIKRGAVHLNQYFATTILKIAASKEYEKYVTKERQIAITREWGISSKELKSLAKLDIKLTGYDKMYFNPFFEFIHEHVSNYTAISLEQVSGLSFSPEEKDYYDDHCRKFRLAELPFIKKLKTISEDPMIQNRFEGLDDIVAFMDQYPERAKHLKALVLSILKHGSNK